MLDFTYSSDPENKTKSIKWILLDSLIIAGIAFVSALPSDRLPTLLDAYVALKAFIYSFLLQLAVERGIKPRIRK